MTRMSGVTLATRSFNSDDQALFARLSGDYNPIHMDPLVARRTQAGALVVHGIHAVLWTLDKLVQSGAVTGRFASLKVQFTKFIYVGSTVHLKLRRRDDKSIRAELVVDGLTTTTLFLTLGRPNEPSWNDLPANATLIIATDAPVTFVRLDDIRKFSGWMDVAGPIEHVARQFPHIASTIGPHPTSAIALLSRLVGMICPGLHSLFAAFAIELVDCQRHQDRVEFRCTGTDERFRMVRMNVCGAGVSGSVQAFLRWPPIAQASLTDIAKVVAPTEFAGSTALIIGGSRGLGSLTAKVIAAGGGRLILTYATGRSDAAQLIEEIHGQVGRDVCRAIPYDARQSAADQLGLLNADVTHLYYFATGPIARQKEDLFVTSLFDEFTQVYVKGFYDCCEFVSARGSRKLTAYYPSSIFVENSPPGMTEYSMAKMAGEMLCENMNRANSGIHVLTSRLPRLLTDQTATVSPGKNADPFEVMLPIIRRVQKSGSNQLDLAGPGQLMRTVFDTS